jgi:hypothetical protein
MANTSGNSGCVVLVVVIALIAGGIYGVRSCRQSSQTKPFQSHLSEYTFFPNLKESGSSGSINGKVITIDKIKNEIDDTFFDLPTELKASKPEEVGTVVWVSCSEHIAGTYVSGSKAWVQSCEVTVIDKSTGSVIGKQTFSGDRPPQTKTYSGDWHGSKPKSEIVDYIKSLKH